MYATAMGPLPVQTNAGDVESRIPANAGDCDLPDGRLVRDMRQDSADAVFASPRPHQLDAMTDVPPPSWPPPEKPHLDPDADGDIRPLDPDADGEIRPAAFGRTVLHSHHNSFGHDGQLVATALSEVRSPRLQGEDTHEFTSEAPSHGTSAFTSTMRGRYISYEDLSIVDKSRRNARLAAALHSNATETVLAVAVVANLLLMCLDTDARADQPDAPGTDPAGWVTMGNFVLLVIFAIELILRIVVERTAVVTKPENLLDCVIVTTGTFEAILFFAGLDLSAVGMVRVLRLCRLLRLLRVLKLFKVLKELNRLIQMMGSCFRTLFWSTLLLILVMTVFACIAVELINPLIQELANEQGYWSDCYRCQRSFSTVFNANLTLFQTIIAGDSWGLVAVPLIEHRPWTALVLAGSLMTLVFGVLNLIVAVIVDTFAEKRSKDVTTIAQDLDSAEIEEKDALHKIFERIDENMDGTLTYPELIQGAKRVAEFRHWLRVLDIDASDLHNLFVMVDEDGSGEVDPQEFIDAMYRIKNSESKTAMRFVKHLVTSVSKKQASMENLLSTLQSRTNQLTEKLEALVEIRGVELKVQEDIKRVSVYDQAELQNSIDVAVTRASQIAVQAALQAFGSAAQTFGDKMVSIDQDAKLSRLESGRQASCAALYGDCWGSSRSDRTHVDQQHIKDNCPRISEWWDYSSHSKDKLDSAGGHEVDVAFAPASPPAAWRRGELQKPSGLRCNAQGDCDDFGPKNASAQPFAPLRATEGSSACLPELGVEGRYSL